MFKFVSRLFFKFSDLQYLQRKLVHAYYIIGPSDRVHIGNQVDLQNVVLNTNSGHIYIGDHSFFGLNCMVLTGKHDPHLHDRDRQQNHPTEGSDIHIGTGVWIASGAIICSSVKICDNAVIAAGAVVTKDCLEEGIYAGVPAKKIRAI